jgi:hypothetical protein
MAINSKNKRITITIDRELDKAIDSFLENTGPVLRITSKSDLFQQAVIEWFSVLEQRIHEQIKNTKKGD